MSVNEHKNMCSERKTVYSNFYVTVQTPVRKTFILLRKAEHGTEPDRCQWQRKGR